MKNGKGEPIRHEGAAKYAAWVTQHMTLRGWNQATLSRRSGLKKQTVGQIMRGESTQPTAWQVAALSKAFGAEPNEIFEVFGLWNRDDGHHIPNAPEIVRLYRDLGFPERRAFLKMGSVLKEMQLEYAARLPDNLIEFQPKEGSVMAEDETEKQPGQEGNAPQHREQEESGGLGLGGTLEIEKNPPKEPHDAAAYDEVEEAAKTRRKEEADEGGQG